VNPRREFGLLLCATRFLTRAPVPPSPDYRPGWLVLSARYFPLVGQAVGAVCALVLIASSRWLDGWLPALLAVSAGVLLTGGFHEDGLADTADGLGGGQSLARRLEIMKDSHLGSYGVLALCLTLGARVGSLAAPPPLTAALALIAAHGLARAAAVAAWAILPYAGVPQAAKSDSMGRVAPRDAIIAVVLGLWPLAFLPPLAAGIACVVGAAAAAAPALAARRLLGGRTGDVLGAVEQMFEVGFLLACAAMLAA
jgi:adenosylcobinamide-GDP ribazoletransferase